MEVLLFYCSPSNEYGLNCLSTHNAQSLFQESRLLFNNDALPRQMIECNSIRFAIDEAHQVHMCPLDARLLIL